MGTQSGARIQAPRRRHPPDHEFFIDLLFYNYLLRRFIVIDLKVEDFKPEFTGKMSFYLTAVDELERQPGDEPSIHVPYQLQLKVELKVESDERELEIELKW